MGEYRPIIIKTEVSFVLLIIYYLLESQIFSIKTIVFGRPDLPSVSLRKMVSVETALNGNTTAIPIRKGR